jgi:nitrate reductase gamma subunit
LSLERAEKRREEMGNVLLVILTYTAYVFIVVMYGKKAYRFLTLPMHLRWDLYPVMREPAYRYGGSYYELPKWWNEVSNRPKNFLRCFLYVLKDTFYLGEYFNRNRSYWSVLLPWHLGFILIIALHVFCFLAAVAMVFGLDVAAGSPYAAGQAFYYLILVIGVSSFILGLVGSIGVLIKRLTDPDLRAFASPINYFGYVFTLIVFLSGLYALKSDPTFSGYREFWTGVITLSPKGVEPASALHIVLFDLFLLYLPLTRSMHYITRFFAFFKIYWDDEPNVRGSERERKIEALLGQPVTWSAPHINGGGKKWTDLASGMPKN